MPAIVQVEGLTRRFGRFTAVDNLSFTVEEGDVYGFLGQNGAGKSTTIRMLLTLIRPTSGRIRIFGQDLLQHRAAVLSRTGAMIERPDLYKYLTAYENLALFARMSGLRPARPLLMGMLERVGLTDAAHKKAAYFSQGMKQRLGIAVALVHDPRLIILDEPTNGLDPQGIADMRQLIIRLSRDEGRTVIISSHLLSEVEQMANRMLIIHRGRKVVEGEVARLLDPAHTLVELDTTDDRDTLEKLRTSAWAAWLQPGNSPRLMMDRRQVPELVRFLVDAGVSLCSVQASHSLENYFLSLTTANDHVDPAEHRTL